MTVEFVLKNGNKYRIENIEDNTFRQFANTCFPQGVGMNGVIIFNDIAINKEEVVSIREVKE